MIEISNKFKITILPYSEKLGFYTKALLSPMLCEEGAPLAQGMSQS